MKTVVSPWQDPAFGTVRLVTLADKQDAYTQRVRTNWSADVEVYLAIELLKGKTGQVVDIGASIGTWCLPVALGSGAHVLAVEPLPDNANALRTAIDENDLSGRVAVMQNAIMDKRGSVRIEGDSAYGVVSDKGTTEVQADSLDAIAGALDRIDFLKMDVEGCERMVLQGGSRTLARTQHIMFGGNGAHALHRGHMPQDVVADLEAHGFKCYMVNGRQLSPMTSTSFQPLGLVKYFATRTPGNAFGSFTVADLIPRHAMLCVKRALFDMKPGYGHFMRAQLSAGRVQIDPQVKELIASTIKPTK